MKKYYKAKLTTDITGGDRSIDCLIVEARNPLEAMRIAVAHCEQRKSTKKWFVEDLIRI